MNTHLREALTASIDLTARGNAVLAGCIAVYDNDDALARRFALEAFEDDRPAYWTTAGYSAQRACLLQLAAHRMSLSDALAGTYHRDDRAAALDTLIPLNDQAAVALVAEYAEHGLWRDLDELMARRGRAS